MVSWLQQSYSFLVFPHSQIAVSQQIERPAVFGVYLAEPFKFGGRIVEVSLLVPRKRKIQLDDRILRSALQRLLVLGDSFVIIAGMGKYNSEIGASLH